MLRKVSTFDPSRLQKSDFHDVSNTIVANITPTSSLSPLKRVALRYAPDIRVGLSKKPRFPSHARGFFYFEPRLDLSPSGLAGEIRLRCTASRDPASFASGFDLIDPTGMPWSIPLLIINRNQVSLSALEDLLLQDGLVTPALLRDCRDLNAQCHINGGSTILHSLNQPFPVRLDRTKFVFWTVGNGTIRKGPAIYVFSDWRSTYRQPVYSGMAIP